MLWDVPISFMDLFDKWSEDLAIIERLLASPPGKFLELGMDHLLTGYFWWGSASQGTQGINGSVTNKGALVIQP